MDLGIDGLRVVVTAGAAGIGLEIARAFVQEDANVVVCDVDADAVANVQRELPGVHAAECDVVERTAVADFIHSAAEHLGGIDVLVNNAGIAGPTAPVEDVPPEEWDRCLEVCLTGQFNCSRIAVPYLRDSSNPSIVNLSSLAGRLGFALRTPYAAAKWGVIGFTKSLAIELGGDGIRVNAILPGIVSGDRQRRVMEAKAQRKGISFKQIEAEAFSYASIKDYVTPKQIADQILFLTSPLGKTISGQSISICGDINMLS